MPPLPQQPDQQTRPLLPQTTPVVPPLPPDDPFEQSFQKHQDDIEHPRQAPPKKAPVMASGPSADPRVGADPLRGILDPLQVGNDVKHQIWDAYHGAPSPEEF